MSYKRKKVIEALRERGFTGEIEIYVYRKDGWYLHCDQCSHKYIGQNYWDCLERTRDGTNDQFL